MSHMHPAAIAARRKYWTRHDAYRFAPPGTPEAKMPGWLDPSATRVRLKEAQEEEARAQEAAAQEEFERDLLHLRWEVKKLKLEHERGSSSRNTVRTSRATSWGGGRVGQVVSAMPRPPIITSTLIRSSAMPVPIRSDLARNMRKMSRGAVRSICLKSGSWAVMRSRVTSGKSHEFLLARVREHALSAERKGDFFQGFRVGSFSSLEAANRLVNATVAQNPAKIERIMSGQSPREELVGRFDSITGYEAHMRSERTQPYIRETDGVVVVSISDRGRQEAIVLIALFP